MESLRRGRLLVLIMPAAVILLSALAGCEGSGDPMKASDGTPLKTPSEVRKETAGKTATAPSPK